MNVDGVFIITLSNQFEKQQNILDNWKGININFFVVERNPNPKIGCFESHMDVIRMAKEKGLKRILILEDDAEPLEKTNNIIKKTNNSLNWLEVNDPKWEFFLLGFFPVKSKKTKNKNILNLKCSFLTHAYIVNVKNVDTSKYKWNGITQVDEAMFCDKKIGEKSNIYGIVPMLVKQDDTESSINKFHVLIQEQILHRIGQDNVADISCYVNIKRFLIFIGLLLLLTPILIIVSCINYKYPINTTFTVFLVLYILILFSIFISLFL